MHVGQGADTKHIAAAYQPLRLCVPARESEIAEHTVEAGRPEAIERRHKQRVLALRCIAVHYARERNRLVEPHIGGHDRDRRFGKGRRERAACRKIEHGEADWPVTPKTQGRTKPRHVHLRRHGVQSLFRCVCAVQVENAADQAHNDQLSEKGYKCSLDSPSGLVIDEVYSVLSCRTVC